MKLVYFMRIYLMYALYILWMHATCYEIALKLHISQRTKFFAYLLLTYSLQWSNEQEVFLIPFYNLGRWGPEGLSNFLKIT